MELEAVRDALAKKRASCERIDGERMKVQADLEVISKAAKAAEGYAHEKALFAVINPSAEAQTKAEEAKANYTTAFESETDLRDRLPLLSAARKKLEEEIEVLLREIKIAEDKRVADTLTSSLEQIDDEIVSVTGRLLARARALGMVGWDLSDLVKDRIIGRQKGPLRDRIVAEAEAIRTAIATGRA